jgi:FkbM family methyltransferase
MNYISHIGQDRWVAETLNHKRCGFFLDFGGFDGLMHSNTFYLERFLNWRGVLVEPNPLPYSSACAVRSCITINAALWTSSRESLKFTDSHGLSSIVDFQNNDSNTALRKQISNGIIEVDTINPTELLKRFSAPTLIDYMSLDVEGAELAVLTALDLDSYKIALMSIEHNHEQEKKMLIRDHLKKYSYDVIEHRNDDFFFNMDILSEITKGDFTQPLESQKNVIEKYRLVEY